MLLLPIIGNYVFGVSSDGIMFIPSFVKIIQSVKKLKEDIQTAS